ncbi:MAG: murein transglycosylase [Tabrizicola sp.]|nr:murein transglycosylase [Tabrizicola sp.]
MRRFLHLIGVLAALTMAAPAMAQVLDFEALDGWQDDSHGEALVTFLKTCKRFDDPDWRPICALAAETPQDDVSARSFFELFFKPVLIGAPPALFTGYYEPELDGSPVRTVRFAYPIYRKPAELVEGSVWYSREEIEGGIMVGRGLELAWLDDPIDVYFLQIQGSGRIRMPDGHIMRVGYAAKNGQPYRSIGQELVNRGLFTLDQVSARVIRDWVKDNPVEGAKLLNFNPSYVFFRKIADLPASQGPIGAMGRSITPFRSIAVDPLFTPLGAPVWIEKDGDLPMRRLMVAQDTGGAIKGMQRADIFFGTGFEAGDAAGMVKDGGRMIVLLPIDRAYAMLEPTDE